MQLEVELELHQQELGNLTNAILERTNLQQLQVEVNCKLPQVKMESSTIIQATVISRGIACHAGTLLCSYNYFIQVLCQVGKYLYYLVPSNWRPSWLITLVRV